MSLKGVAVVLVVLVAAAIFGYITFMSSEKPTASATVTPTSLTASTASPDDLVARGKVLFAQFRCTVCHTTDGGRAAGPTMKGLAGSQVKLNTGAVVTATEAYLRQSVTDPDAQLVAGYGPDVMSAALDPFTSQINQDDNVNALVAYIESLK